MKPCCSTFESNSNIDTALRPAKNKYSSNENKKNWLCCQKDSRWILWPVFNTEGFPVWSGCIYSLHCEAFVLSSFNRKSVFLLPVQVRPSCADWPQTHCGEPLLTDKLAGKRLLIFVLSSSYSTAFFQFYTSACNYMFLKMKQHSFDRSGSNFLYSKITGKKPKTNMLLVNWLITIESPYSFF